MLALGAHPDDIEIAAGGTLLSLAARHPGPARQVRAADRSAERQQEARAAARAFTPGADLDGRAARPAGRPACPPSTGRSRRSSRTSPGSVRPDVILAPSAGDAHQDHRTLGELVPTAFRNQLCLAYEIPKWDGDMTRPNTYFPLTDEIARRKVELLDKCYPSQREP